MRAIVRKEAAAAAGAKVEVPVAAEAKVSSQRARLGQVPPVPPAPPRVERPAAG
jgi:hypothetical protein